MLANEVLINYSASFGDYDYKNIFEGKTSLNRICDIKIVHVHRWYKLLNSDLKDVCLFSLFIFDEFEQQLILSYFVVINHFAKW